MSDFIRVPRAFKKRSKRSVLPIHTPSAADSGGGGGVASGGTETEMGRKSFKEKEKRSFKRGSVKERWLLTRKTWKFMTDAGRRLLPEGVGNKADDIPKIEQYFQEVCRNEHRFLVWRRKCSYPGASGPLPRRRWKRRFGTVSPKKASSADEAEDDYFDTLERVQYEQLMIDMLKNYLNIKDEDEERDDPLMMLSASRDGRESRFSPLSTTTSMVSLDVSMGPITTTANIKSDVQSKYPSRSSIGSRVAFADTPTSGRSGSSLSTPSSISAKRTTNTPFPIFSSSRDSAPAQQLLANLRRCGRGSSSSFMDQITPEVLNDKVALRKLYEQLRATQKLNRFSAASSMYRIPNPKPHYQRSALGMHKTFAFPELSGKSRGLFMSLNKVNSDLSTPSLCGIDECASLDSSGAPQRPERRIFYHTEGIQTETLALPTLKELSEEYKKHLEQEEAMMREEELALLEVEGGAGAVRNNDRRNSEDVSQSVSDTIKRYLRMARKKPKADDVNRFKRINYDQNLRNIKAKGETTKIGDDDGTSKGCQTDSDWILKSFAELSKDAPTVVQAIRPSTLPGPKLGSKHESPNATSPVSSPSSPGGISSNLFHTSTQFLSNLFGHTQSTGSGATPFEGSSNDSIYCSSDAAAMQKSKSSSNVGHIVSRKIWKSRSKSQSRPTVAAKPQWTPQGNCIWTSSQGHTIRLRESALNEITEVERKILYQLAIGKINQFNLGVNTESLQDSVTSRSSTQKPAKRKALLIKRKALTTGFFDSGKDEVKGGTQGRGRIFGISLEQSAENELKDRQEARSAKPDRRARNSLSSLMDPNPAFRCSGSCESLPSKTQQLSDNELLKGSLSQFDVRRNSHEDEDERIEGLERSDRPQVPNIIVTCVQHLEKHGLHSVGIFRKSTSKKRVRQLREDFDQGTNVDLDDDVCPDDVATLLKEYLRDLPEPLLCRRLYQPFINTQKVRNRRLQFEAITYLVQLLPVPHRDTLLYLLKFLAKVARYADDVKSPGGEVIQEGNKMDTNNLATVFAPNILHNAVAGQVTTNQEVDERLDVINVVRIMIDHWEEMFRLSDTTIDEIYMNMIDSNPAQLDILCDRLDYHLNRGQGPDSSDASGPMSPTSPPPTTMTTTTQTTAQLLEANKQKRLYAREEFLHQNSSSRDHGSHPKPARRHHRDSGGIIETSLRSASIDDDVFAGSSRGRRTSSPFSMSNVLTASLKIPVQMMTDDIANIPYIEDDRGDNSSSASGSRRGTSGQPMDSRKSSSSGTITGTLSLVQSPSLTMSPTTSNSTSPDMRSRGQVFFGDDDFKEQLMDNLNQGKVTHKAVPSEKASTELRKSSSLTVGVGGSVKKLFDTKAPTKQKLSIHPSSIMTPQRTGSASGASSDKMTAISSIGGDLLRSKTADFERLLIRQNNAIEPRTYKRKELISSVHNSKK